MASKPKTKKPNVQPTPGYIIVEPFKAESKTESGIYLPDSAEGEKPLKGKVVAVGDTTFIDGQEVASPAKVGDIVIYKQWGGSEVKIEGVEYLFSKFEDILAIQTK